MFKLLRKLFYRVYILYLSFKRIFHINLGDYVWYKKNRYLVANGNCDGMWRLIELKNNDNGLVNRNDCRKSWTFYNLINSFKSGYKFYMLNWYDIWVYDGIEDWMKKTLRL